MNSGDKGGITGFWNSTAELTIGNLIIFLQELHLLAASKNTDKIDIYVASQDVYTHLALFGAVFALSRNLRTLSFCDVDNAHSASSNAILWPTPDILHSSHTGSNKAIGALFPSARGFVRLCGSKKIAESVAAYLLAHANGKAAIAIHLKNSQIDHQSNAKPAEWHALFEYVHQRNYPCHFFLVGNENLSAFRGKLNVTVVQDDGLDLTHQLALIASSSAFMGMSSGPCNVAVLSDIPYVIYKDPDHHSSAMEFEMGTGRRFSFSQNSQYFLREFATRASLIDNFETLQKNIRAA